MDLGLCRSRLLSSFLALLCLSAIAFAKGPGGFCARLACVRGIISVTKTADGSQLGYISNTYPNYPNQGTEYYLLTTTAADALIVELPTTNIETSLRLKSFNLLATNPANPNWNYLGASVSIGAQNLDVTPSLALFTGTKAIPVGPPQTAPAVQEISDGTVLGESQIWFLGCLHEFFSAWTNKDGTSSDPDYFYLPPGVGNPVGLLGMSVNIAAFSAQAIPVTFTFITQC